MIRPRGIVTLAATQRTGSTLVSRTLEATGLFGRPREILLPARLARGAAEWGVPVPTMLGRLGQAWRRLCGDPEWRATWRLRADSMRRYLEKIATEHVGGSGIFCWKVMWDHYKILLLDRGLDATVWGAPISWIRVRRQDRLRQAVSFARACQTQQWMASQPAVEHPTYDSNLIAKCEAMIDAQESGWDDYFARHGIQPLVVTYESLETEYPAAIRRILDHLGHGDVDVPPPNLQRQSDELTDEWVTRYRGRTIAST